MNKAHSLALTLLVGLGLPLCSQADLTNGLIFHASFDQSAKADTAKGKPDATVTGTLRQTEGVRGNCAVEQHPVGLRGADYSRERPELVQLFL